LKESHEQNEGRGEVLSMDQCHKMKETCCIACDNQDSDFSTFSSNKAQQAFHIACFVHEKQKKIDALSWTFKAMLMKTNQMKILFLKIRTFHLLDTDLLTVLYLQFLSDCRMHYKENYIMKKYISSEAISRHQGMNVGTRVLIDFI
jgi:hypothetical protein